MLGAIPVVSSLLSAGANVWGAFKAPSMARADRRWNANQAQLNRDFQERMAGSQHQREVADLRAAGLNPILSAGGQGAAAPAGSMASGSDVSGSVSRAMTNASQSAQVLSNVVQSLAATQELTARANLTNAQAGDIGATQAARVEGIGLTNANMRVNTSLLEDSRRKVAAEIDNVHADTSQKKRLTAEINERIKKLEYDTSSARSQSEVNKAIADFSTGVGGDIDRWTDAIGLKGRDLIHLGGMIGILTKFFSRDPKAGREFGFRLPE